jgi:DNA-binding response OmpR family regulator
MPRRLQGKCVLLVEDEALIALDAEDALTAAGCRVVGPADRLDRAMRMAETETLDAAVLDVNLAGEMVWPVAEILRAREIPFLFLTGFGRGLDPPAWTPAPPMLTKPVKADELTAALRALVARSPASRKASRDRLRAATVRN